MRRLPGEGDGMPLDPERTEYRAHGLTSALQDRPLLDVQLEISGGIFQLTARLERAIEIDAVCFHRIDELHAIAIDEVAHLVRHERAGDRAGAEQTAAETRALLIGPIDQPYRDRRRAFTGDSPQHLQAREHV